MSKHEFRPEPGRKHIIALTRWHSILALIALLITFAFSLYGIAGGIAKYARAGENPWGLFQWFTTDCSFLTVFSASMIIPFAVQGIRNKYFSYPKWIAMFHYSGMLCTTLTLFIVLTFMSWVDPNTAFGDYNWYLHIVSPSIVIIAFFLVDSGYLYTLKDSVIATLPVLMYICVYAWQVFCIGKVNGGWEDLYQIGVNLPIPIPAGMLATYLLTLLLSLLIGWLDNRLTLRRRKKLMAGLWSADTKPVMIKVEVFGLGRYMGEHADAQFVEMPLDLIRRISDRYGLTTEELARPYFRGFLDSINVKQEGQQDQRS